MKIIYYVFLFFFLNSLNLVKSDSSKIYNKNYSNPVNVLNSFLWKKANKGSIGLISKINIENRELGATIHPVSLDSEKIKIVLSKIKFEDNKKENDFKFLFDDNFLEILSKYVSKGLKLANQEQDVIFKFKNKNNVTQGIFFAHKNSLNLVFFQINGCEYNNNNKKKKLKKKKEFHKNHPNFSFIKKKDCDEEKTKIFLTSNTGIYKKKTNKNFSWVIFTPNSWKIRNL